MRSIGLRGGARFALFAFGLLIWTGVAETAVFADSPPHTLTVEELIKKLEGEDAWARGFCVVDPDPPFGIEIDHKRPAIPPIQSELVRRGLDALPKLLDHVDDARPTGLVVDHAGGMWHSDEYQSRYADPKKHLAEVNTGLEKRSGFEVLGVRSKRYRVRVGDLCFGVIGQIVNRRLYAARGQPSMCIVINSPVETPALAAAIKKEWRGLTADQHKQSLLQDALAGKPYGVGAAVTRLLFYYPEEGEELAVKLLGRPLHRFDVLWNFVSKELCKADDPAKQKTLLEEFRTRHGQAASDAVPFRLRWIYWETHIARDKEFLEERDRAQKILARFYPDYDPYRPAFINAAEADEQENFISNLGPIRSERVHEALFGLFRTAAEVKGELPEKERRKYRHLAYTCASRLIGKGHDEAIGKFLAARIKAIETQPEEAGEGYLLEGLRKLQNRLK